MTKLNLAFDPSSSLSKGIYNLKPLTMEWMVIEPETATVSKTSLEQYLKRRIGEIAPEDEAWVEFDGKCYAVGFLARRFFYGETKIEPSKKESAICKILTMVGAIAMKAKLPPQFYVSLGVLLPYGEYGDRGELARELEKTLSNFKFRGKEYRVKMERFNCLPEGAGVLMRGMDRKESPQVKTVLAIMLGYRNASYLLMERGKITKGETKDFGFIRLTERVAEELSGVDPYQVIVPIVRAGNKIKEKELEILIKANGREKEAKIAEIVQIIQGAREQHWLMLRDWLSSRNFPILNEVIFTGGTAPYYKKELDSMFADFKVNWVEALEEQIKEKIGQKRWEMELKHRLTDVYGYFYWMQANLRNKDIQTAMEVKNEPI